MDTIFFWLSKTAWWLLSPDILLLIVILFTWLLLALGANKLAKKIHTVTAAACLLIAFLPLGSWLLHPLENRFPVNPVLPQHIDGIIVLGGAENAVLSSLWKQPEPGRWCRAVSCLLQSGPAISRCQTGLYRRQRQFERPEP